MNTKQKFIRLAIAMGLVGLAACGGSDSSSGRQRNAAVETNVIHYSGTIRPDESNDVYRVDFDVNLDTESATPIEFPNTKYWVGDYRRAFSNLSIKKVSDSISDNDLSKVTWAQCPYSAVFASDDFDHSKLKHFVLQYTEVTDGNIAAAECGTPQEGEMAAGLYNSDHQNVALSQHKRLYFQLFADPIAAITSNIGTLKTYLPEGLGSGSVENNYQMYGNVRTPIFDSLGLEGQTFIDQHLYVQFGAEKVKDYAPYDVTATADEASVTVQWTRSADLGPDDNVSHMVRISDDNFTKNETMYSVGGGQPFTHLKLPSCEVEIKFPDLKDGGTLSFKVEGKDPFSYEGDTSDVVTITKTADSLKCLPEVLPAPANVSAQFDNELGKYSIKWDSSDSKVTYCVQSSYDSFKTKDEIVEECEITSNEYSSNYMGWFSTSFRVVAFGRDGQVSEPSDTVTLVLPRIAPPTDVKTSMTSDGLMVKWSPGVQVAGVKVDNYSLQWGVADGGNFGNEIRDGFIDEATSFLIPVDAFPATFVSGSELIISVLGCTKYMCGEPAVVTYAYPSVPKTEEPPIATGAPEVAAKAAIVNPTVTEVKVPLEGIELSFTLAEVSAGLGVAKEEIKSVEVQVAAGEWTTITDGQKVSIPKGAKKLTVRVAKTNGETVESVKTIVNPTESTDTTMATEDTTVTESTVVTTAPDSDSGGNNTIVIVIAIVVLLGAAGAFIKLKK